MLQAPSAPARAFRPGGVSGAAGEGNSGRPRLGEPGSPRPGGESATPPAGEWHWSRPRPASRRRAVLKSSSDSRLLAQGKGDLDRAKHWRPLGDGADQVVGPGPLQPIAGILDELVPFCRGQGSQFGLVQPNVVAGSSDTDRPGSGV